jgi:hypothetical protein
MPVLHVSRLFRSIDTWRTGERALGGRSASDEQLCCCWRFGVDFELIVVGLPRIWRTLGVASQIILWDGGRTVAAELKSVHDGDVGYLVVSLPYHQYSLSILTSISVQNVCPMLTVIPSSVAQLYNSCEPDDLKLAPRPPPVTMPHSGRRHGARICCRKG